jgi:hypothetical protein
MSTYRLAAGKITKILPITERGRFGKNDYSVLLIA